MIDRATIDKIMDATNIVDVVGEFVTLRKAGVNYKGLCPFHDDKTPSFMVSPSKQICKCFACGEGGTAINFLMKHEQITYPEAPTPRPCAGWRRNTISRFRRRNLPMRRRRSRAIASRCLSSTTGRCTISRK